MIPKILHYVWVGKEAPEKVKKCIESWKKYCPDWEIKCWNETNLPMDNSWLKSCYNIGDWALGFFVDYVKPWAIYNYGGIWVDADTEIIGPLDDLLENKCFIYAHPKIAKIATSFIGGEKGSEVFKSILDWYEDKKCPQYKFRFNWNSIYTYTAILERAGFEISDGKDGDIVDTSFAKIKYVEDLDNMKPYAIHKNIGSWGRATKSDKELSVLISFKNEGAEVARTCKSVRDTAGDKVDIIVLNDCSDDGFNYKESLEPYNVLYLESDKRLGSSLGKQLCVDYCTTPYFLILDGHCRMFTKNWLNIAIEILRKGEDCIYCCDTQFFTNDEATDFGNSCHGYGAYFDYKAPHPLGVSWLTKKMDDVEFEVPSILGANYLCSKIWWSYIKGFQGLRFYGREEPYISRKSWMLGGSVKCIPQIQTGHKQRVDGKFPYKLDYHEILHNEMVIARTLIPERFDKLMTFWEKNCYTTEFTNASFVLNSHLGELAELQKYYEEHRIITAQEVDKINHSLMKKYGISTKLKNARSD